MKRWPDGCGNRCWDVGCMIVCRIGKCVAYNEIVGCAYCAAFPCEESTTWAYQGLSEKDAAAHEIVWNRLKQLRASLAPEEIKSPKSLKPIRANVVAFPESTGLPEPERAGLAIIHRLLVALLTAAPARTYVQRNLIQVSKLHMLDVLWQLGLYGELVADGRPYLWMEKDHSRELGLPMPDLSRELARFGEPNVHVENVVKRKTSPKNREIRLSMDGPDQGLHTLRALQKYVRALCDAYGKPEWQGSHRYSGKAHECFTHADMHVFAGTQAVGVSCE